jgi:hypothetical protein
MPRRAGRLVASLTSLFVALCTTWGVAPLLALSQAIAPSSSASAPMCPRTGECGSSCPTENQPRPSDCKGCSSAGCGFLVKERVTASRPAAAASAEPAGASPVTLVACTASRRIETLSASPPRHVLLATFRN